MPSPKESSDAKATRKKCHLILSNGQQFEGTLIGAPLISSGQMVFSTGMVGYSEAITDPSYFGQILTFSYPLIGNYGIPSLPTAFDSMVPRGFESLKAHTAGVIVTTDSSEVFHWNSNQTLDAWLREQGIPGIVGLDTRHLVQMIRNSDNLLGSIQPVDASGQKKMGSLDFSDHTKQFFDPSNYEILDQVSCSKRRIVGKGKIRIGLIDCGVKWNIVRQLIEMGCEVELLPWTTDLQTVDCQGWLISNGPGDPRRTAGLCERISRLLGQDRPILGICLGHQLLALAAGANTVRMQYGHRSHNQPVIQVGTRRGFITSQNHGYVVDEESLPPDWQPWFINANDQTIEGIQHRTKPFHSVQFHPEAAGGPRDTGWILEQLITEVTKKCR